MFWDERAETLPREELRELQERRLRRTVEYAYNHSPFYRRKLREEGIHPRDIKTPGDLTDVPFTTKEDLRRHYPLGMLAVPREKAVRAHASSGTTGKPVIVPYTRKDLRNWSELMARVLTSCGFSSRDTVQLIYNYAFFTGGLGFHYGAERVGAMVIPSGVGNTAKQLMVMEDLGVTAFSSTPSYALYLAEYAEKEGLNLEGFEVERGVFGAEPWSEGMRAKIERAYGIEAYDNYGLSELCGPGVGSECEEKRGMHIWEDHFLMEVIDSQSGEPVKEGEKGELVFTTLTKEGMPLLRYRSGDISRLLGSGCPCGRSHSMVERITGRSDDMLIVRGINVFPSQIEEVLLSYPQIGEHYQIVVDRETYLDQLRVEVEATGKVFGGEAQPLLTLAQQIERKLKDSLGIKARVKFVEPGSIPRSAGKAKRVVDLRERG